jgi:hypothetical protein
MSNNIAIIAIIANKFLSNVIVSSFIDQIEDEDLDHNLITINYICKLLMTDTDLASDVNDLCINCYEEYLNDINENMIYTSNEIYNYLELNGFFLQQLVQDIYQHFHNS